MDIYELKEILNDYNYVLDRDIEKGQESEEDVRERALQIIASITSKLPKKESEKTREWREKGWI